MSRGDFLQGRQDYYLGKQMSPLVPTIAATTRTEGVRHRQSELDDPIPLALIGLIIALVSGGASVAKVARDEQFRAAERRRQFEERKIKQQEIEAVARAAAFRWLAAMAALEAAIAQTVQFLERRGVNLQTNPVTGELLLDDQDVRVYQRLISRLSDLAPEITASSIELVKIRSVTPEEYEERSHELVRLQEFAGVLDDAISTFNRDMPSVLSAATVADALADIREIMDGLMKFRSILDSNRRASNEHPR